MVQHLVYYVDNHMRQQRHRIRPHSDLRAVVFATKQASNKLKK